MAPATIIGGLLGLGVQLYCNAVRKLPLMRNPWEHVLFIGAGAAFGNWLVDFEERTALELKGRKGVRGKGWGPWEVTSCNPGGGVITALARGPIL